IICYFFALSFLATTIVSQPYRRPDQIETLLAFKDEFDKFGECNNSVARSWIRDAISFDGVVFDSETGVVTKLDLRGGCLKDTLGGNSSLFKFHHLRYLDLSYNNINSSSFLAELGRLTNLESLDLSNNDLVGKVPSSISNLSRLTYLDLSSNNLNSSIPLLYNLTKLSSLDLSNNRLQGKVPEWLCNLPSLTALSLSHNSFDSFKGSQEEVFLNSSLVYLYLTSNAFQGPFPTIPETMRYMVASNNGFTGEIPLSLCNPRNLSVLDLSNNNFSGSVPNCLSESLTVLNLRDNKLRRLPDMFYRSDSLKTLDLEKILRIFGAIDFSGNRLEGQIPESIGLLKSLMALDLSNNRFKGYIPSSLGKLTNLESLDLSRNQLSGRIPQELASLTFLDPFIYTKAFYPHLFSTLHIFFPVMTLHVRFSSISCFFALSFLVTTLVSLPYRRLDQVESLVAFKNEFLLSCNNSVTNSWTLDAISFDGVLFDEDTGGVTELKLRGACLSGTLGANNSLFRLQEIRYLDLSFNDFSSSLPAEFGRLTDLEYLDLHQNRFTGELPSSISSNTTVLTKLYFLDLSNNSLQGKVPEWLWNLPSLTALSLSHNSLDSFEGSPESLHSSSVLVYLFLNSNAFRGYFPNIPPTLKYILASDNNFTGEMPLSLCNSRNLLFLDLSNNRLSGSVPRCLSGSLALLNLHHNNLSNLPDTFSNSSLKMLDVSHNQISGKFPRSLVNCKSLEFVNVESNCFSDTFPFWLKSLPNLQVLILRSNRFYGPISSPHYPLTFSKLMIVDISRNMFDGSLPPNYFVNWSAAISLALDPGPRLKFIGDSYSLGFHPSMSMNNKGINMMFVRILNFLAVVDFSGNKFGGEIPESIGLLKSLIVLNLSNNGFTGHIPSSMGNLSNLESLDISINQLSGTIPQELGKLLSLEVINMSYNKLTGQIPQGSRFQTQNESAFEGNIDLWNIDLCGFPLQKSCFRDNVSATTQASHASKAMHTLNSSNPLLLFSILIVFHFVLLFSIPLSTSL
ncbi:unnamed protein product, partial [Brassica rapa subsp. trilocularis]